MSTAVHAHPAHYVPLERRRRPLPEGTAEIQAADAAALAAAVRATSRLFFWSMRLLARSRRRAMYALFTFCHEIDAIAAEPSSARRTELLAGWRREIVDLFEDRPQRPQTRALAHAVRLCGLPRDDFLAVIQGRALDYEVDVRAPSLIELDVHCAQVAVSIGKLAARIHGMPALLGDRVGAEIGRAFRLTSILHDLADDAARGRLYLPRDVLRAHGIYETDPKTVLGDPALPEVCAVLARRAERHYADAMALIATLPHHNLRGVLVIVAYYRTLLAALTARGWIRLDRRVRVPPWRKAQLLLRWGIMGR